MFGNPGGEGSEEKSKETRGRSGGFCLVRYILRPQEWPRVGESRAQTPVSSLLVHSQGLRRRPTSVLRTLPSLSFLLSSTMLAGLFNSARQNYSSFWTLSKWGWGEAVLTHLFSLLRTQNGYEAVDVILEPLLWSGQWSLALPISPAPFALSLLYLVSKECHCRMDSA